jgi:hypothetical protein
LRTVFGAWSGKRRTTTLPWLVCNVAVSVSAMRVTPRAAIRWPYFLGVNILLLITVPVARDD